MLQLLKNNDVGYLKELRRKTIARESLLNNALIHTQDIGSTPLYALYCGYLTLLDASAQDGTLPTECAIDFPNKEVRLAVALLELKSKYGMQCVPTFLLQLPTLAARGDVAKMMTFFYHFIADAYGGTDKSFFDVESYYQGRLYDLLKCCFKEANVERPVITGRMDVNFVVNDHATGKRREYILELKMTHRGTKAAAIQQVWRYTPRATSSEWVRLVLFFNKDLRNLSDWVQVSDTGHIIAQIDDQQREIFNRKSAATDTPEGSSSARVCKEGMRYAMRRDPRVPGGSSAEPVRRRSRRATIDGCWSDGVKASFTVGCGVSVVMAMYPFIHMRIAVSIGTSSCLRFILWCRGVSRSKPTLPGDEAGENRAERPETHTFCSWFISL
eukprot:gene2256-biopygen1867